MMTGNYLTTPGRAPEQDRQMLTDLEMTVETCS
jgi:biotin synthase-like enzyme